MSAREWLSATDLASFLACRHLARLNLDVKAGHLTRPDYVDPTLATLIERGQRHESAYLASLRASGRRVAELGPGEKAHAAARVLVLMREGYDVIPQAQLQSGRWHGYADFLVKAPLPSSLGAWSYEVADTKLARQTKAGAVLQLALYSDMLEELQGARPRTMTVVAPGREAGSFAYDALLFDDYRAFYRLVRRRFEAASAKAEQVTYPEPVPKCDACEWYKRCDAELRAVDHLSFVARMTRLQRDELAARGIDKLAIWATQPIPLTWTPARGSRDALERTREQARVQLESRGASVPKHELLPLTPGRGLARLPEPSPGDIFFDFEGDPFVAGGGLEYLFGYAYDEGGQLIYARHWALDHAREKQAFETFTAWLGARLARYPDMHVYHFAPYEPAALKRLMLRHASCVEVIDDMLRREVFVDLLAVVREGVRVGVESYSIKRLEPCFGYVRELALDELGEHKRALEAELELAEGRAPELEPEWLRVVEAYNRDDCMATLGLRNWLEGLRAPLAGAIDRPKRAEPAAKDDKPRDRAARELREHVKAVAATKDGDEAQALTLLANLVEFHIREEKVVWWELFRLRELAPEDLEDEPHALTGLTPLPPELADKRLWRRYAYAEQVLDVKDGDNFYRVDAAADEKYLGHVIKVDRERRVIVLHRKEKEQHLPLSSIYFHKFIGSDVIHEALCAFASAFADGSVVSGATCDLLLRRKPRFVSGGLARRSGDEVTALAYRLARDLNGSCLPVQGPPGTGKTHTGAHMIARLADQGFTVGVTATSHKVISNLMDKVAEVAREQGLDARCLQKVDELSAARAGVTETKDAPYDAIADKSFNVIGGTAWVWVHPRARQIKLDYVFVDEAGQVSLANALAVSTCAKNLVLLGDPRQLEQPQRGAHPEGAGVSALEHLFGRDVTIKDDAGLFLGETWRLHPSLTRYTTSFYEGRLASRAGLEAQAIEAPPLAGVGLYRLLIQHSGRRNESFEEVAAIRALIAELLHGRWTNASAVSAPLTLDDILVVAPYNAQVARLKGALPDGARVGTVDKFQGQEAPVVVVSMTASTIADAPRGAEFLLSLNRMNVATSRARCACVLVGSPSLFDLDCRTPKQMRLANALCAYAELSTALPPPHVGR